jgi:hypothetical protein
LPIDDCRLKEKARPVESGNRKLTIENRNFIEEVAHDLNDLHGGSIVPAIRFAG